MHLRFRNVTEAFNEMVSDIDRGYHKLEKSYTRNGPVLYFPEPVTITYERPWERVLLNFRRDANPFFHLFESMWMLAGRNDLAPLLYYVSTFGDFSDDGRTLNGAYGYRWRHKGEDQLEVLIKHLKDNPDSRRAILQMWNVEDDLLKIDSSKDVCCNLSCCFSIRTEDKGFDDSGKHIFMDFLDMTVFNRSNDLIWGTFGANAVHFSFLQEYMARKLEVHVGVYHQLSNNLHVYTDTNSGFKPKEWLPIPKHQRTSWNPKELDYTSEEIAMVGPLSVGDNFDQEVKEFVDCEDWSRTFTDPFLMRVAAPMMWAFRLHKERNYTMALNVVQTVESDDWKLAGEEWLSRRQESWEKKNG
jgi:thymidylate synthase